MCARAGPATRIRFARRLPGGCGFGAGPPTPTPPARRASLRDGRLVTGVAARDISDADTVHAVPLIGGCESLSFKHVPEMSIARVAENLDPSHPEGDVLHNLDAVGVAFIEGGPPAPGGELCGMTVERITAACSQSDSATQVSQ